MQHNIRGSVDLPAEVPPNRVSVSGWIFSENENSEVETVLVRIGPKFHIADFPITRSDVAEALKNISAEKSGWRVEVDLEPDVGKQLEVSSFVITRDGGFHLVASTNTFVRISHPHSDLASVYLAETQLVEGDIDRIELVPEHRVVRALGWVISRGSPVVGILAHHSGRWSFANCDQYREDVVERYLGQVQPGSYGWCIEDKLLWGELDAIQIRFYALLEDKSLHLFAIRSWNPTSDQLVISRIVPQHSNSNMVRLEGWLFAEEDIDYIDVLAGTDVLGKARINTIDIWRTAGHKVQTNRRVYVFDYTHNTNVLKWKHTDYFTQARYQSGKHLLSSPLTVTQNHNPTSVVSYLKKVPSTGQPKRGHKTADSPKSSIRIGVLTHRLDIGGAQLYLRDLINELRRSAQVELFVVSEVGGLLEDELRGWGIQVRVAKQLVPKTTEHVLSHVELAAQCLATFKPNVILANTLHCGYASDIAKKFSCPSVLFIHESYTFEQYLLEQYGLGQVSKSTEDHLRESLRDFDAVVFEAEETLNIHRADIDRDRQHLIRYGIPVSDYPKLRKMPPTPETNFLSIATFSPRKNQLSLVQAFARVARRHPCAHLRLIGSGDDPYSEAVYNLVRHLDVSNQIFIEPVTPDVYQSLISADIFVSASDIESMPRSMMEAMLAGCPVLASSAPGVSELVGEDVTGWLVGVRDVSELERGFEIALSKSPMEIRHMGERATNHILSHHDTPQFGARVRALIDDLLQ